MRSRASGSAVRCLVTGGAGFIGSHLVQFLLQQGCQVRVLDDFSTGSWENLREVADQIECLQGSITQWELVQQAMHGVDWVCHLAALVSVPKSMEEPNLAFEINAWGTQSLLEAARQQQVKRFVFVSSAAVYGSSGRLPKREGMKPAPISPYGCTKLIGEQLSTLYWRTFQLPTVTLRLFNVYGARQNPHSPYAAVIPRWLSAIVKGEPPILYGDGKQVRDFVYIEDVLQAFWLALNKPSGVGGIFNIGSGTFHSLWELLAAMEAAVGRRITPQLAPPRPGDIRRSYADIRLAQHRLGFKPTIPLAEGIRRTLLAYQRENG